MGFQFDTNARAEESFEDLSDDLLKSKDSVSIQPLLNGLTNAFMDPETEAKRRTLESMDATQDDEDLSDIEENTAVNVKQNNKIIAILNAISGGIYGKRKKSGSANAGEMYDETLYDNSLQTEWLAGVMGDGVDMGVNIDRTGE